MAKLTDALVSEFARVMAPKPKRPTSSYVFGTARNNGQHQVEVKVNGDDTYRVMKSSVKVKDGDKVVVLVKNRTGLVTSNISTPTMNPGSAVSSIVAVDGQIEDSPAIDETILYAAGEVDDGTTQSYPDDGDIDYYQPYVEPHQDGTHETVDMFSEDDYEYINFGPKETGTTIFHRILSAFLECDSLAAIKASAKKLLCDYAYINHLSSVRFDCWAITSFHNADFNDVYVHGSFNAENMNVLQTGYIENLQYRSMTNLSDRNLKKDISDTEEKNALGKINKIRHRQFKWKYGDEQIDLGYIAQELDEIDPNLDSVINGRHGVNISYLLPLMTKAIQELSTEVEELRKEVKRLGKA